MKIIDNLLKTTLDETDFVDAPVSEEPDGTYQILMTKNKLISRNVETGEILVEKL